MPENCPARSRKRIWRRICQCQFLSSPTWLSSGTSKSNRSWYAAQRQRARMTAYKRISDNRRTNWPIGQRPKSNRKDRLGLAEFVEGDGWVFSNILLKSENRRPRANLRNRLGMIFFRSDERRVGKES